MNINLTYTSLKTLFAHKGYNFREGELALNLGAIRSDESKSNKFDDLGFMAWQEKGKDNLFTFNVTTDPGKAYLLKPMNKDGTIITVPNQYIDVFGRGLHNGNYECFKQHGKMLYVRDNNKDDILDFDLYRDPEKLKKYGFWAVQGTNYHRASEWKIVQWVENYSAGCTVVQSAKTFNDLIILRDRSVFQGYKLWDYTLFEQKDYIDMYLKITQKSYDLITNNQPKGENITWEI